MDLDTLRAAIVGVFPELAESDFALLTAGWDCVAVDVDDRLIFKFPRHRDGREALLGEAALLDAIRPAVTIPIPQLNVHVGPPLFSWHCKIRGEHLLTEQYEALGQGDRQRLAADLALFYAQLHHLDARYMGTAGAKAIEPWLSAEEILRRARPIASADLWAYAERTIEAWQQLPTDPHGTVFGFFDGHGWNMAFDYSHKRLNGMYDFGDAGFGSLQQEFIYSNWISADLTQRIVGEYELVTGLALDRERINILTGVIRLSELAQLGDDDEHADLIWKSTLDWAAR
ncbi:aminoglycoside phosphotransferase family protein [bacterium]|nr:MAG: aminoglycoside phosphotransferase family protein [bacterium]